MAEFHEDMVQKTKKQIQHHFIALVEAEGFSHVSVKKIAERANINRGTFYLHYTDKYELMDHLQQELLNELQTRITAILPKEAFLALHQQQLYPPFVAIFQFISEHAHALRAILGDKGDPSFAKKIKLVFGEVLLERLISQHPAAKDEAFRMYMHAFMTSAILGVIQEWLENCEEQTAEEMAKIHFQILNFISQLRTFIQ
ncbi:TetR/AcrR family transcriptional regulator [Peribacillus sp. CSMR9]|uniref:TetR/AcrR family transcriptional regulator n=1 Tax=Peribacillus sp. CSMR9 TaxID=2981350 RepID=UPI000B6C5792|nr:TetR/AcrR family transcriptional regulator C-terminal domain-containing protein [Peribacillus sp. CSMR9]MDV7765845.1 TetR/AcrR family transcriptional regulator C-terminal domain-containing protein [Peribacillus sp. CSMR9]SNT10318.1 transcriptional regulator, TetR family [Bacillus sp. OK838]